MLGSDRRRDGRDRYSEGGRPPFDQSTGPLSLLDESFAPGRKLLGGLPERPQGILTQLVPELRDRGEATPVLPGLEREPSIREPRGERDAELTRPPAAIDEAPVPPSLEARWLSALAPATLAPMRDHVPGIPEAARVVVKSSVR